MTPTGANGPSSRWAGRNGAKDELRAEVWTTLETTGTAIGPAWSRIPNFAGADLAARHLAGLPAWQATRVVKCNPDPPQIAVRLRALYEGKTVYAPVPELTSGTPFIKLDPGRLTAHGISFELAATSQGFLQHGEPIAFEDMPYLPVCIVGCVAVSAFGGRTGKGAGFADLELGIFRDLGKVDASTVIATTVHSSQVVEDGRLPMQPHDSALARSSRPRRGSSRRIRPWCSRRASTGHTSGPTSLPPFPFSRIFVTG